MKIIVVLQWIVSAVVGEALPARWRGRPRPRGPCGGRRREEEAGGRGPGASAGRVTGGRGSRVSGTPGRAGTVAASAGAVHALGDHWAGEQWDRQVMIRLVAELERR